LGRRRGAGPRGWSGACGAERKGREGLGGEREGRVSGLGLPSPARPSTAPPASRERDATEPPRQCNENRHVSRDRRANSRNNPLLIARALDIPLHFFGSFVCFQQSAAHWPTPNTARLRTAPLPLCMWPLLGPPHTVGSHARANKGCRHRRGGASREGEKSPVPLARAKVVRVFPPRRPIFRGTGRIWSSSSSQFLHQ
jgi:hypothetical protein